MQAVNIVRRKAKLKLNQAIEISSSVPGEGFHQMKLEPYGEKIRMEYFMHGIEEEEFFEDEDDVLCFMNECYFISSIYNDNFIKTVFESLIYFE
jgi:hypothetical protein